MTVLTEIPGLPAGAGALGETNRRNSSFGPAFVRYAREITSLRAPQPLAVVVLAVCALFPISTLAEPAPLHRDELVGSLTVGDYDTVLDDALEAFDKQDYARARVLFERALALRPNARVLRGLGIAALHLKRFTSARRELKAALTDSRQPLTATQREGVADLLSWMEGHLGTVQLQLRPTYARLTIGDEQIVATELVLEPGAHRLQVSSDGFEPQEHTIYVEAGKEQSLAITLEPRSAEARAKAERTTATRSTPGAAGSRPRAPGAEPRAKAERTIAVRPTPAPAAAVPRALAPAVPPARDDDSSVLESWWFWTAVGVVVAGGVATTVMLTSKQSEPSYQKDGLGGVIEVLRWSP